MALLDWGTLLGLHNQPDYMAGVSALQRASEAIQQQKRDEANRKYNEAMTENARRQAKTAEARLALDAEKQRAELAAQQAEAERLLAKADAEMDAKRRQAIYDALADPKVYDPDPEVRRRAMVAHNLKTPGLQIWDLGTSPLLPGPLPGQMPAGGVDATVDEALASFDQSSSGAAAPTIPGQPLPSYTQPLPEMSRREDRSPSLEEFMAEQTVTLADTVEEDEDDIGPDLELERELLARADALSVPVPDTVRAHAEVREELAQIKTVKEPTLPNGKPKLERDVRNPAMFAPTINGVPLSPPMYFEPNTPANALLQKVGAILDANPDDVSHEQLADVLAEAEVMGDERSRWAVEKLIQLWRDRNKTKRAKIVGGRRGEGFLGEGFDEKQYNKWFNDWMRTLKQDPTSPYNLSSSYQQWAEAEVYVASGDGVLQGYALYKIAEALDPTARKTKEDVENAKGIQAQLSKMLQTTEMNWAQFKALIAGSDEDKLEAIGALPKDWAKRLKGAIQKAKGQAYARLKKSHGEAIDQWERAPVESEKFGMGRVLDKIFQPYSFHKPLLKKRQQFDQGESGEPTPEASPPPTNQPEAVTSGTDEGKKRFLTKDEAEE